MLSPKRDLLLGGSALILAGLAASAAPAFAQTVDTAEAQAAPAQFALNIMSNDLVFSDIVMPGSMNGVDLAHEIHRRNPVMPIMLTTGFSGQAQIDPDLPLLRKPYQFEELETVVSRALRH